VNPRLKKFVALLEKEKLDAYLLTSEVNVTYLTAFRSSESWLLVTWRKVFYITDFRYVLEAKKGLKGIPVKQYTRSIFETSFQLAKSAKVLSSRNAAKATCALNAGVCVRRVRRADFFAIKNSCRQPFMASFMHGVSTEDAVQISGATSRTRRAGQPCEMAKVPGSA
jgi:Xaa-Pro aminopeptidase